jgi:hypothetical protein
MSSAAGAAVLHGACPTQAELSHSNRFLLVLWSERVERVLWSEQVEWVLWSERADIDRTGLRYTILSVWAAWPQIWLESVSEASFGASGRPKPRYGQNAVLLAMEGLAETWARSSSSKNAPDTLRF